MGENGGEGTVLQQAGEDNPEQINAEICLSRLNALYQAWERGEGVLNDCDALFFLTGRKDGPEGDEDDLVRRGFFHLWVFTLLFPATLVVLFKDRRIAFSAKGKKKMAYFRKLLDSEVKNQYSLEFYPKDTSDMVEYFKSGLLASLEKSKSPGEPAIRLGTLLKEDTLPLGKIAEGFMQVVAFPAGGQKDLDAEGYSMIQRVSPLNLSLRWRGIDDILTKVMIDHSVKTIASSRTAAGICAKLGKDILMRRIKRILDQGLHESHAVLCDTVEEKKLPPQNIPEKNSRIVLPADLDVKKVDVLYALVESGSNFTLDPSKLPNEDNVNLQKGAIVFGIGVKYNDNAANIARTILIDTGQSGRQLYLAALEVQDFLLSQIKPGAVFNKIFQETKAFAAKKHPLLAKHLKLNFGGVMTNKLSLDSYSFDEISDSSLRESMVLTFGVAALNIPCAKKGCPPISIWLMDTCVVPKEGSDQPPEILTDGCPKKEGSVCLQTNEDADETAAPQSKPSSSASSSQLATSASGTATGTGEPASEKNAGTSEIAVRIRSRRRQAGASQAEIEKLLVKQRELRRKKEEEIAERFRDGSIGSAKDKKDIRKLSNVVAYRDTSEFPRDLRPHKLAVDVNREAILVPIGQSHVAFHASTIRNVSSQGDDGSGKFQTVRISFFVPGATKSEDSPLPDLSSVDRALFIKELIIRSLDPNMMSLVKSIRELTKGVKNKEANQRDEVTTQQALSLNRSGRRIFLRNLSVRYTGGQQKKIPGQLEAHLNGLRYTAPKNEAIDIICANVKHAFFQPVQNELIVLIHFHLLSPIIVAKKKVFDIQFYCESTSQSDDLDLRRNRSMYDPDEILEEQRELEKRKRLNQEFRRFVEGAQELASMKIDFEVPIRELSFTGVPRKSSVILTPTSNCLVQLTEWPAFVLTMDEVELVSFERVRHGLKLFDMTFVFKDYNRPVSQITSIPVETLDMIKSWLNDMDLVWYERGNNLMWSTIFRVIKTNIAEFVKNRGFSDFLQDDIDIQARKQRAAQRRAAGEPVGSAEEEDDDEDEDDASDDDDDDDEEYQEGNTSSSGSDSSEESSSGDEKSSNSGKKRRHGSDDEEDGSSSDDDDEGSDDEEAGSGEEEDLDDEEEDLSDLEEVRNKKRRSSSEAPKSKKTKVG